LPKEAEFLLARGSRFVVVGVRNGGGKKIIEVALVHDE